MNIDTVKIEILIAERMTTQKSVAEKCGIARQNLNAILKRKTCMPKTAGRIADALNVPVAEIISESGDHAEIEGD